MRSGSAPGDFCDYLTRHNMLPLDVIAELRRGTRAPQLGKILLDRRSLDVRQIMHIVAQQADEPRMKFGELAMRNGFIDELELQAALRDQRLLRRHPAEVILERGIMKKGQLLRALIGYTSFLEGDVIEGEGAVKRLERASLAPPPPAVAAAP